MYRWINNIYRDIFKVSATLSNIVKHCGIYQAITIEIVSRLDASVVLTWYR